MLLDPSPAIKFESLPFDGLETLPSFVSFNKNLSRTYLEVRWHGVINKLALEKNLLYPVEQTMKILLVCMRNSHFDEFTSKVVALAGRFTPKFNRINLVFLKPDHRDAGFGGQGYR